MKKFVSARRAGSCRCGLPGGRRPKGRGGAWRRSQLISESRIMERSGICDLQAEAPPCTFGRRNAARQAGSVSWSRRRRQSHRRRFLSAGNRGADAVAASEALCQPSELSLKMRKALQGLDSVFQRWGYSRNQITAPVWGNLRRRTNRLQRRKVCSRGTPRTPSNWKVCRRGR